MSSLLDIEDIAAGCGIAMARAVRTEGWDRVLVYGYRSGLPIWFEISARELSKNTEEGLRELAKIRLEQKYSERLKLLEDRVAHEMEIASQYAKWLKSAEAERDRLRGVIEAYLSGSWQRPVAKRYREDGKPSKHDNCEHDVPMWQDCEQCIDAYFSAALTPTPEPEHE